MMKSDDKGAVLVTGAASGIGRAIAVNFAERGNPVVLFDRDETGLAALAEALVAEGKDALPVTGDVTRESDMRGAVERASECYGGLACIVCSAGIARTGDVREMSQREWDRIIAVNLTGVFIAAHCGLDALVAHGAGSFIAISSDAGVRGSRGYAAYCASKHGVVGFVRALALDVGGKGVRCNVVCPSFVETPMADSLLSDGPLDRSFYEQRNPMGRFAQPREIAEVVQFLASPDASFINGAVMNVDGGSTSGTF